jgi:hypothetical protein
MGQVMRGCTDRAYADEFGKKDWSKYIDDECKVLGYQNRDTIYQILQFNRYAEN